MMIIDGGYRDADGSHNDPNKQIPENLDVVSQKQIQMVMEPLTVLIATARRYWMLS